MKRLSLYLDASIINFALAEDIPLEEKQVTQNLCSEINKGKFDAFISEVVLREIGNTKDSLRRKNLFNFIKTLELGEVLELNDEISALAERYINEKIIPLTYRDDALHIALTSVNGLDVLVSWNFQHLVKHKTRVGVVGINTLLGYKNIDICAPWEVAENV